MALKCTKELLSDASYADGVKSGDRLDTALFPPSDTSENYTVSSGHANNLIGTEVILHSPLVASLIELRTHHYRLQSGLRIPQLDRCPFTSDDISNAKCRLSTSGLTLNDRSVTYYWSSAEETSATKSSIWNATKGQWHVTENVLTSSTNNISATLGLAKLVKESGNIKPRLIDALGSAATISNNQNAVFSATSWVQKYLDHKNSFGFEFVLTPGGSFSIDAEKVADISAMENLRDATSSHSITWELQPYLGVDYWAIGTVSGEHLYWNDPGFSSLYVKFSGYTMAVNDRVMYQLPPQQIT